jgi:hypothetical protein
MPKINDFFSMISGSQPKEGELMHPFNGDFYGPKDDLDADGNRKVYNLIDLGLIMAREFGATVVDALGDGPTPALGMYRFKIDNGILYLMKPGSDYNPWFEITDDGQLAFNEPYDGYFTENMLEIKDDGKIYYDQEVA